MDPVHTQCVVKSVHSSSSSARRGHLPVIPPTLTGCRRSLASRCPHPHARINRNKHPLYFRRFVFLFGSGVCVLFQEKFKSRCPSLGSWKCQTFRRFPGDSRRDRSAGIRIEQSGGEILLVRRGEVGSGVLGVWGAERREIWEISVAYAVGSSRLLSGLEAEMVAGAEVMHQVVPLLEASFPRCSVKGVEEVAGVSPAAATSPKEDSEIAVEVPDLEFNAPVEPLQFVPNIRSGSFADIGPRRCMEDEHIRIDDLSGHLGSLLMCPSPNAFYGVFDGHGGSDAAAYMKRHAIRLFFEDSEFPQASQEDEAFSESVENSIRKAFLNADLALAHDSAISRSSGTTALAALIFGRQLLVANAGDCRAVLCRKGVAVEMSCDHRPTYEAEHQRVSEFGGYIEDGYLNGVLSVTRALGDWDMKMPQGSPSPLIADPEFRQTIPPSPLIADPEFRQTILTEDDEFLVIGCDGIWDVMTSQHAVSVVRKGLRRHDDPERCARELAMEAKRLHSFDNLTAIVICFVSELGGCSLPLEQAPVRRIRCCKSLSAEALCKLRSWLEPDH